ncbi:hypothetical protein KIW84_075340 [Lathyrus oleraceus]|uniref:Uncharacterized protein n=1 Tax=Pisum sativum TaxID=3888 RepID=A0A9D4VTG5_PEA|nr:hypothetical protein KIW84_075340 [Pisum sativum]
MEDFGKSINNIVSKNSSKLLNPWMLHYHKLGLELKCPLCLSWFKQPVLFPYNHLVCSSCMSDSSTISSECALGNTKYAQIDLRHVMNSKLYACSHHAHGGKGAVDLGIVVQKACENATQSLKFFGYRKGFSGLPICMANTPYSFSNNAAAKGAPTGFVLPIRDGQSNVWVSFVAKSLCCSSPFPNGFCFCWEEQIAFCIERSFVWFERGRRVVPLYLFYLSTPVILYYSFFLGKVTRVPSPFTQSLRLSHLASSQGD